MREKITKQTKQIYGCNHIYLIKQLHVATKGTKTTEGNHRNIRYKSVSRLRCLRYLVSMHKKKHVRPSIEACI